jgi:hypothetical protein
MQGGSACPGEVMVPAVPAAQWALLTLPGYDIQIQT